MRVGFVGCGLNSDYHNNFVKDYDKLEIVCIINRL